MPGHERLHGDGQGAGQGVPRRPAAGEDGDRRGVRRRVARRRRDARPHLAAWPTTSPRTSATRSGSAGGSWPGSTGARRSAVDARARTSTTREPDADPDELLDLIPTDLKEPFDPREVIARICDGVSATNGAGLRRVQAALRLVAGHRLGAAARPADRHPRQRPGRAVQRGGAEGDAVHPARQPDRHPAAVPAQHHRLHGRQGVRAGRDHQARRDDDQRGLQQHRAAPQRDHGGVVRRRQLRHERPRLRPALPVHLAEREVGGDGSGPARRGARDRGPAVGGGQGRDLRRRRLRRDQGGRRGAGRGAVAAVLPLRDALRRRRDRPPRHPHHPRHLPVRDREQDRSRAPTGSGCSGCDRRSSDSSWPTAPRSLAASSAPAAGSASRRSRCTPTPMPTCPTCARPTPPYGCPASRPPTPTCAATCWSTPPGGPAPTRSTPATASCRRTPSSRAPCSTPGSPGSARRPSRSTRWARRSWPRS